MVHIACLGPERTQLASILLSVLSSCSLTQLLACLLAYLLLTCSLYSLHLFTHFGTCSLTYLLSYSVHHWLTWSLYWFNSLIFQILKEHLKQKSDYDSRSSDGSAKHKKKCWKENIQSPILWGWVLPPGRLPYHCLSNIFTTLVLQWRYIKSILQMWEKTYFYQCAKTKYILRSRLRCV